MTSETIAHLLQLECTLRQQLSRGGQRSASDPDEAVLDEVRRSLSNIVGRLHAQQSGTPGEQLQSARAAAVTPTAYSTAAGRGQDGGGRAGAKSPQDGSLGVPPPGGAEVDEDTTLRCSRTGDSATVSTATSARASSYWRARFSD